MAEQNDNIQQQPAICKTRDEMLAKFLTDDSLNDIILKGTDSVEVPANRFLLSARSEVFKGMLLGKFQEASLPVVELSFTGSVLQAVVEFVLTDDAQILNSKKRKTTDGEEEEEHVSIQQIESLVSLAEAASYFNIAGLGELVMDYCTTVRKKWPCLSFAFLQVCRTAGNSVPDVVLDKAKKWVRKTPAKSVSTNHVGFLSKTVMEEILMDSEMEMSECDLFIILSLWVEADPSQRKDSGV
ncbi:expressed unknown protein [Seminavis robusta]|uniref:BTB domain-containing protein n=1 Tax=Seminavis robusta TaxID=568900 RepID=A0A9N8HP67_9STRA|nr:expressed unknown protein [Seminavis robusta]|eukprot:Sro1059_g236480.1 n/a (241) ;mRNA; f:8622-9417